MTTRHECDPFGTGGLVFIGLYLLSLVWIGWLGRQAREENSMLIISSAGRAWALLCCC